MPYVCGIDENGLGPKLGPLTVTAVLLEVEDARPRELWRRARRVARGRALRDAALAFGDSKRLGGFAAMGRIERTALLLGRAVFGPSASFAEYFAQVSRYGAADLRRPCPAAAAPKCWTPDLPLPVWDAPPPPSPAAHAPAPPADPAPERYAAWAAALRDGLAQAGIRLVDLRSALCCPGVLNARLDSGLHLSKLGLEFVLIEDLLAHVHARVAAPVQFVCGRLGGTRDGYPRFFRFLRTFPCTDWEVRPRVSRYEFEGLGSVSFVEDAEDAHLPVGLASVVGKYVREGFVHRENLFFGGQVPGLAATSGYHNAATERFVAGTEAVRRRAGIPDDCFVRRR
ncbi:MAG: hypothetical protein HZA54_11205 [Planctomycetes bacterium]|nr:hypothetical protein [Planctomycetota bacterium]